MHTDTDAPYKLAPRTPLPPPVPHSTLLHGVPRFPPSHSHSTRTLLRYFALRVLRPFPTYSPPPLLRLPPSPSHSPILRLPPSLSLSFHFPFDSVSSFRYLASFFPPSLYFALSASDNSFLSHRLDLAGSSLRKDDSSFDPDTYERNITTRIRVVSRADNWRVNCVAIESSFGSSFRPPLGRDGSSFRGLKGRENYYRFRVSLIVLSRSFDPLSAPRFTHPICPLPFHLHCPDLA